MATYLEIYSLVQDGPLRNRTAIAALIAADTIRANAQATSPQQKWAASVLQDPLGTAAKLLPLVLVQNKALTLAQITSASDAALQSAVDAAVPLMVASYG